MQLPPIRLLLTGIFVTFGGSFHFGYQLSAVNPTEKVLRRFFNHSFEAHYDRFLTDTEMTFVWSAVTGILILGAFLGALIMPRIAESLGRRRGLFISSLLFIVATFPSALSYRTNSFELFTAGRFIFGLGIGLASGFQGLYLSEISPKQHRGFISVFTGLMLQLGLTIGAILGIPSVLGTETAWAQIFWFEIIPSFVLLVVLGLSHDSPTFLLARGEVSKAKLSLIMYGDGENPEIVMASIRKELELQKESLGVAAVLGDRLSRKGTLLGVVANSGISFSGVIALSFFATYMLTLTGFSHEMAAYANIAIAASNLFGSCLSTWSIEKFGRRPLLLLSCFALSIINCIMMALIIVYDIYGFPEIGYAFLGSNILFMLVFGLGIGPIPWFITTEMVPQNSKAAAQGLAVMVQYFTGFVTPVIFLPMQSIVGAYSFLLFAVPMFLFGIYFYICLPETKNKTTREVLRKLYGPEIDSLEQNFSMADMKPVSV